MTVFYMEFCEKDGVSMQDKSVSWSCCSTQLGSTETGKVGKVTVQVPNEREIDKVVSAVVIRVKDRY